MTVTETAVPAAVRLMVVGSMLRYASPAACVMEQTAAVPLFGVTVNCEIKDSIDVFSGISVNVMEKGNSCSAPGSPVMAAPLFVWTEFARYLVGRTRPMPFVPVKANVNFDELVVPEIVTDPPPFATDAVGSIVTNSALPACMMVRVFDSTPEAENIAVVCLAVRPVRTDPVHDTVSSPLPLVLLGVTHDAYAITLYF